MIILFHKLKQYYKLLRLDAPTGYLLSFFPAAFGQIIASEGKADFVLLTIFFIGSIITRSAGCIINDILDRNFDSRVERTKHRVLADNSVSLQEAVYLLFFLFTVSFCILLTLNRLAIYIGIFAFFMILLYPLMKRVTNFAQVFLGITFNLGVLIGYAAVSNQLTCSSLILYLSVIFWTIGYDSIYGFMDIKDDKKIGLNSMAIFLENRNYKLWLLGFYGIFIILFLLAAYLAKLSQLFHPYNFLYILLAICLLYWQVNSLDINSSQNCFLRFKSSNFIGILLLVYLLQL